MKQSIMPFNLLAELDALNTYSAIENDVVLFEKQHLEFAINQPFKIDVIIIIICLRGTVKGSINLKYHNIQSPFFMLALPDQILQLEFVSDDFDGRFIVLSQRFANIILSQIQDRFPLFLSTINHPVVQLDKEQQEIAEMCFHTVKRVIATTENPYRLEIVKYLIMSAFYGFSSWIQNYPEQGSSKQEIVVKQFLSLVRAHCIEERGLNFYADKLCITPKHLSKVIKGNSNMSAAAWIDHSVVLEAKVLLKSTNMTIQQISDKLNFTSQSFFGRFFKRVTGMSPREYRGK